MKRIRTILLAVMMIFPLSAKANDISLNGSWKLKFFPQPEQALTTPEQVSGIEGTTIDATVPGNVEIDMLAAGLIEDPMIGNNVYKLRKYEGYQWAFSKSFSAPELAVGQKIILNFEGLDTFADIFINGQKAGSADNMFIAHDYDVTSLVKQGVENKIDVIIRSSVLEAQKYDLGVISIGNFANEEGSYIRRAPHTYGWDIMPRLVSAGIWRDVNLKVQNPVRVLDSHWMTAKIDLQNRTAELFLQLQTAMPFEKFDNVKAVVSVKRNGKEVFKDEHLMHKCVNFISICLSDVDFWWPRGYGDAALYDAEVAIVDTKTGEVYDIDRDRIGVRTVSLVIDDVNLPGKPGKFNFVVNGVPVFAKGSNWVPLDALHSRDKDHVDHTIGLMADMNCNIVRCWGGNVYEDTHFFDLCDENGIMVWQDFAMGCNNYPQRDDFAAAIEKEAISVVKKLRSHPSLVLWSGNNEDDLNMAIGRFRAFNINPNMDRVSREVLKRVLFEYDPIRPYLPSSPYYSERVYQAGGGDNALPENHLWGPRGYYKADFYVKNENQFVSEIGYHGCPNMKTLQTMFTKDCVYPWINKKTGQWNDEWQTKAVRIYDDKFQGGRNDLMTNQVHILFGEVPAKLEDFVFASQSVQAEAMKYFVEFWRGGRPYRTGIIWWNVRDGWPILSDAITDYYGEKKMAYHFIKNVQRDVCVMINDPIDRFYQLKVANDTRESSKGKVSVKDVATGEVIFSGNFVSNANSTCHIASIPERSGQGILQIDYEVNGKKFTNHYLYGRPPFKLAEYKSLLKKLDAYPIAK